MKKYIYHYVLQGHYGQWEDLCAEETLREAREQKKCYQINEGGLYRIVKRRELNKEVNT